MAFNSYRTSFKGNLSGVSIKELRELDYNKETFNERLAYINDKYDKTKAFYDDYIFTAEEDNILSNPNENDTTEYYKVNLNKTDELSSEINIFKYIEADANYLLNSTNLPRDKQQKYRILKEEDFKKILTFEKSLSALEVAERNDEVMDIMASKETNDYINMAHKITKKDLTDEECGAVLSEYNNMRNILKKEMEKCKNKEGNISLYKIKSLLQAVNDDMIISKIQLKGIRSPAKKLGDIGSCPDYDSIDYTNINHIKNIIRTIKFGELKPDSMISHLAYDMEVAIKTLYDNGKLNKTDIEIIECYNSGYTLQKIGEELGIKKQSVHCRLKKIFKKISEFYLTK